MERLREFLHLPDDRPLGCGVRIGVIDSGVDHGHPGLVEAVDVAASCNCIHGRPGDVHDEDGHGTYVAGIIAARATGTDRHVVGVAPAALIVAFKVYAVGTRIFYPDLQRGIDAAVKAGVDIINISAGCSPRVGGSDAGPTPPWVWPEYSDLERSLRSASEKGILCVLAAGNQGAAGRGTLHRDTGADHVIAAGACCVHGQVWPESSRGPYFLRRGAAGRPTSLIAPESGVISLPKPDLVSLGTSVPGLRARSGEPISEPLPTGVDPDLYVLRSGTSASAAVVSGIAACALQRLREMRFDLGVDRGNLLRRILRAAAAAEARGDQDSYGEGVLRWPAVSSVLGRIETDRGFREMLLLS